MPENSNKFQEQLMNNLPMLLLAGGAIFLVNKILNGAGNTIKDVGQGLQLLKSDEQVKSEQQSQAAIEKYVTEVQKKQQPTQPDGYWAQLAERIYRDTRYSAAGDDHADALLCMLQVKNDADFALLHKYYGRRQETWFGLLPDGDPKDLTMAISSNLNSVQKKAINTDYTRKGIAIRFV